MASQGNFQGKDMCLWVCKDVRMQYGGGEDEFLVVCI